MLEKNEHIKKESFDTITLNEDNAKLEDLFSKTDGKQNFVSKLVKKDFKPLLLTSLLFFLQNMPVYVVPILTGDVIDLITLRPDGFINRIIIDAIFMVVVLLLNIPFTTIRGKISNKMIRRTTAQVKSSLVRKLQRLSITFHKEIEEGKLQSKFIRDIENTETYYRSLLNIITTALGIIVSATITAFTNPIVLVFFIIVVPINFLVYKLLRNKIRKSSKDFRLENEDLSAKITTSIQMMQVVKSHGLTNKESSNIDKKIVATTNAGLRLDKVNMFFGAMLWVSMQLASISCLMFCVFLAYKDIITVGEIVLFQSLFGQINTSVIQITYYLPELIKGAESVNSLSEIMLANELEHDTGIMPVPAIKGKFEFKNVSYLYPRTNKITIKNFNLTVNEGETIAFVGASGSGKTTIINLIIGLISPTKGKILVDGVNLEDMPMQKYRHFISVVPQNPILFPGTIKENITYGLGHYSKADLQRVIKDAAIDEFLDILPNGINSQVGEHGDKLSGGQKQRVSIARALIRDPRILILDEATSALDNVSELHIQQAIEKASHARTTFIVAHRLSTIRNADKIVVLEEGKVIEMGSYEELTKLNGKFSELERLSKFSNV